MKKKVPIDLTEKMSDFSEIMGKFLKKVMIFP